MIESWILLSAQAWRDQIIYTSSQRLEKFQSRNLKPDWWKPKTHILKHYAILLESTSNHSLINQTMLIPEVNTLCNSFGSFFPFELLGEALGGGL